MKIGTLARMTGVSPRLLRYYEEQGLLVSHRVGTGHRHYSEDAPTVVDHIRTLLAAGLPTSVIRGVLPCVVGAGPQLHECVVDTLRDQLRGVDERIETLQQTRTALAALLAATEQQHNAAPDSTAQPGQPRPTTALAARPVA